MDEKIYKLTIVEGDKKIYELTIEDGGRRFYYIVEADSVGEVMERAKLIKGELIEVKLSTFNFVLK